MVFNALLFWFWETAPDSLFDAHSKFMLLAFVIELLIIKISITPEVVNGGIIRRNLRLPRLNLDCHLNHPLAVCDSKGVDN